MNETDCQEWLLLAQHDIDTVDLLIKENGHADIIIYHIHQAIEKMLKALLIKAGKSFDKIHYLDKLLAQVINVFPQLTKCEEDILAINLYLPKLRYPYGDIIDFNEAKSAYVMFQRIQKLIKEHLN